MIVQGESKGSSWLTDALHGVSRRRYRTVLIAAVTIIILSAVWAYHADLDIHDYGARFRDKFTSGGGSSKDHRLLPRKIWQIFLPKDPSDGNSPINPEHLEDTPTWIALNADYA